MRSFRFALLGTLVALVGCQTGNGSGVVRPQLPLLDPALAQACPDPGVRAGVNPLIEISRTRVALGVCSKRHRDTVSFYNRTRAGFAGTAPRR